MAKVLSLLRHAKSDWGESGLDDHERPLNQRGLAAAPLMGHFLADKQLVPDLVLCSDAVRTKQTLSLASAEMGKTPASKLLSELYLAGPDRILSLLRAEAGDADHVLVLGHNPGIQRLAVSLAEAGGGRGSSEGLRRDFPTAALAVFEVGSENWGTLEPNGCRLILYQSPKSLPGSGA